MLAAWPFTEVCAPLPRTMDHEVTSPGSQLDQIHLDLHVGVPCNQTLSE